MHEFFGTNQILQISVALILDLQQSFATNKLALNLYMEH